MISSSLGWIFLIFALIFFLSNSSLSFTAYSTGGRIGRIGLGGEDSSHRARGSGLLQHRFEDWSHVSYATCILGNMYPMQHRFEKWPHVTQVRVSYAAQARGEQNRFKE